MTRTMRSNRSSLVTVSISHSLCCAGSLAPHRSRSWPFRPDAGETNPDRVFDHPAPDQGWSPFLEDGVFFESFVYRQDKALLRFLVICGSRSEVRNLSVKGPTVTFVYSEKGACAIQSQKLGARNSSM